MSVKIRNLIPGEPLAGRLKTGYEETPMPEWIWVAERDGKAVAILITAPAHIMVILLRILSTPEAEGTDVRALLLHAFAEFKSRGYRGYVTWIDPTASPENAFIGIIEAIGGVKLPNPQVVCCGGL